MLPLDYNCGLGHIRKHLWLKKNLQKNLNRIKTTCAISVASSCHFLMRWTCSQFVRLERTISCTERIGDLLKPHVVGVKIFQIRRKEIVKHRPIVFTFGSDRMVNVVIKKKKKKMSETVVGQLKIKSC